MLFLNEETEPETTKGEDGVNSQSSIDSASKLDDQLFKHKLYEEKHTIEKILNGKYKDDLEHTKHVVDNLHNETARKFIINKIDRLITFYEDDLKTINSSWNELKSKFSKFFRDNDAVKEVVDEKHLATTTIESKILPTLKHLRAEALGKKFS